MHLSDGDIHDFQALWREEFGEELSATEMRQRILLLVELVVLVMRPLPPDETPTTTPDPPP